jgi:hypothetical protein
MKHRSDLDRVLETWMADGPHAISDRVVDVVAARIGVQRQHRAWPFQGRTVVNPLKLAAALAAVALIAVVGYNLLPRQPGFGGQTTPPATASPAPSTVAATAAPTPEATPVAVREAPLTGGRYLFNPFGSEPSFTIEATGPDGWGGVPEWAMVGPGDVQGPTGIGIAFLSPDGLFSDPCQWDVLGTGEEGQEGDVTVGPTVDDLVAAIRANESYTSSTATPVTIDGYAAQELEIQLPDDPFTTCDKVAGESEGHAFVFSGSDAGLYAQGPANRWHLSIVDAAGTRLVAVVLSYEGTPQADLDVARNVIETLDITP